MLEQDYSRFFDLDTATGLLKFKLFTETVDMYVLIRASNNIDWTTESILPQVHFALSELILPNLTFI